MKIIHIVHGRVNPTGHNGISRIVYYLNKYEKIKGCDSQIWALVDGIKTHATFVRDEFVTVECFPRVWLPWARHEIIERLHAERSSIDLVHFHLIWAYDKNIIAAALKKIGLPFIITTHGTYSKPHAYTGKRLLAKWLYEVDYLNKATEIHINTREEGTGLQRYGYKGRSFVGYNGIEPNEIPVSKSNDFFKNKPYKDKTKLIWIGVLREDKNLSSLIEAVAMLPAKLRETFVCVLVGPDYKGNAKKYINLSKKLNCPSNFDYIGPLYGKEKYDAIQSADVNVMPSFSEGFSMSLLDFMACAKPNLLTMGCNLNYFFEKNFYVRCEPYPQDIARALEELFHRKNEWERMGSNAKKLTETEFNWPQICDGIIENYRRIISKNVD